MWILYFASWGVISYVGPLFHILGYNVLRWKQNFWYTGSSGVKEVLARTAFRLYNFINYLKKLHARLQELCCGRNSIVKAVNHLQFATITNWCIHSWCHVIIKKKILVIQLPENSWKQEHTVDTRHLSPLPQCQETSYIVLELFR